MLRPDYTEFSRLAGEATLIPVVKSVMADLLTPVSAFLAVAANEPDSFLLESVERGEQIGRYTFLGARPYMRIVARGDTVWLQRGKRKEKRKGKVLQVVKELLRQHQPAAVPGLPPFTAGAVGYFAYDMVRQLEKIGEHTKDDLSVPDCVLMFFDRLLAFDHLRHQIHIIATADVSSENPRRAFDRAVTDIARIEKKLTSGLHPDHWRKTARPRYAVCGAILPRYASCVCAGRQTTQRPGRARRLRRLLPRRHIEWRTQSPRYADYRRVGTSPTRRLRWLGALRRFCRQSGLLH